MSNKQYVKIPITMLLYLVKDNPIVNKLIKSQLEGNEVAIEELYKVSGYKYINSLYKRLEKLHKAGLFIDKKWLVVDLEIEK